MPIRYVSNGTAPRVRRERISRMSIAFDLNDVIRRTGLEIDEYLEIFELYKDSFEELMTEMTRAFDEDDTEGIMHNAHTLKGASSNIGFAHISALASRIQDDPGNRELVEATLPLIREEYEKLKEELESITI